MDMSTGYIRGGSYWQDPGADLLNFEREHHAEQQVGPESTIDWVDYLYQEPLAGPSPTPDDLTPEELAEFSRTVNAQPDAGCSLMKSGGISQPQDSTAAGGSSREGDSNNEKEKAEKAKLRNRRAVQKFRDRQKAKALEKDALLRDMTFRLDQLLKEKEDLRNQNIALESHFATLKSPVGLCLLNGQDDHDDEALDVLQTKCVPDFVPYDGWREINPAAALVLKAQDPPIRLQRKYIRKMKMDQLIPIWKVYVNLMAEELPQVQGDLNSPAGKRLRGMKNEITALCAYFGLHNPILLHQLNCCGLMDLDPLPNMQAKRTHAEWAAIAELLCLSKCQQEMLLKARDLHDTAMKEVHKGQATVERVLQEMDVTDEPLRAGPQFLKLLAAAQTLNKNLEEAHRIFCIFGSQTWGVILDPYQFATFTVTSFPWAPDMWRLVEWAEEKSAASGMSAEGVDKTPNGSSPVANMMSQNFHMLWQWHTDHMTAAISGDFLRKVPTALRMLDHGSGLSGLRGFGVNSCECL